MTSFEMETSFTIEDLNKIEIKEGENSSKQHDSLRNNVLHAQFYQMVKFNKTTNTSV